MKSKGTHQHYHRPSGTPRRGSDADCIHLQSMQSKMCPSSHAASRGPRSLLSVALLAWVMFLLSLSVLVPVGHAIPFRLSDGTISKSITLGRAVDSVLLDRVNITNGVSVVFDLEAMLPGQLHIDLKDCVCSEGSQIYVRGYIDKTVSVQSLTMNVRGMTGDFCSLVFLHNLPERTKLSISDSTIATTERVNYNSSIINGLTDVHGSPLVLYATSLSHSQLHVSNTVLKTSVEGGKAMLVGGKDVSLVSSMVVLDGVTLEALNGAEAHAMYVEPSSSLTLTKKSVFSVTNATVASSGKGFTLGNHLTVSQSVLRFVGLDGRIGSPMVSVSGGTIEDGGWLDLYRVWAINEGSSVASLSPLKVKKGGVVSISRCVVTGKTLVSAPVVSEGGSAVSVQCNRVDGKILQTATDYQNSGLASVKIAPCDTCEKSSSCFGALTSSFSNCTCQCSSGGVGDACLPAPGAPVAKAAAPARNCIEGIVVTEPVTFGGEQAALCFKSVVFSGPITVTIDLRLMDAFADVLSVKVENCLLFGGAQLRIKGVDEKVAQMMPGVILEMTNITAMNGTIVLQDTLPVKSKVLLADSTLRASINATQYTPTTASEIENRYGPFLVLDGVRLVSAELVLTRLTMMCEGEKCAVMLVERDLVLDKSSAFYMDNCAVNSHNHVMKFIASKMTVKGGSVFAIQNNSWRVKMNSPLKDAWECDSITVTGGSVMRIAGNKFGPSSSVMRMQTLTVDEGSWLLQSDNDFRVEYVFRVNTVNMNDPTSTWSILRNNFLIPMGSRSSASMWTYFSSSSLNITVHAKCNYIAEKPLTTYRRIAMQMNMTVHECEDEKCAKAAECFNSKANGIHEGKNPCVCNCANGGYGDSCLPAQIPKAIGPPPPLAVGPAEISCINGGTMGEVAAPIIGDSGLCFVDVHFASPLVIDLNDFRPATQVINITLIRCKLPGIQFTGTSDYAVHMVLDSSTVEDGTIAFAGSIGPNSFIQLVDSLVDTMGVTAIQFDAELGVDSTIQLVRTTVVAATKAITFADDFILKGSRILVQGCRLEVLLPDPSESYAISFRKLQLVSAGHISIVDSQILASIGVAVLEPGSLESSSLFEMVRNTMKGPTGLSGTALFYHRDPLHISEGSKLRVVLNTVKDAALYDRYPLTTEELHLVGEGSIADFSYNALQGSAHTAMSTKANISTPAKLIVGCNKKDGVEVVYSASFSEKASKVAECSQCTSGDLASCYGREVDLDRNGVCSCTTSDSKSCPSCFSVNRLPSVAVDVLRTKKPVDMDTSCVVGQTLKTVSLNMWKTHHCFVGVTFSGVDATVRFSFMGMPLHLPINITFSGCTFLDGAAVHFAGGRDAVESAGVLIRFSRTVMQSSTVSFSYALPHRTDIAITEVDAEQTSLVVTPYKYSNSFAVVAFKDVLLTKSSLVLKDVNTRRPNAGGYSFSGSCLRVDQSLRMMDGSSVYVQHCTLSGTKSVVDMDGLVSLSNHSVFALLNNVMLSGESIMETKGVNVDDFSVFRVVGNSGPVKYGVYIYGKWNLMRSSWMELRENDVPIGEMLHAGYSSGIAINGSSVLTLTNSKMRELGAGGKSLLNGPTNYKFVAGCLTVGGKKLETNKLKEGALSGVTDTTECGKCEEISSSCFAALTTSVKDCKCNCAAGGHGDACVPAPLAILPPTPSLPLPPGDGKCISNMNYPEVTQTLGAGLSSLCYRNVTFSGTFMRLTVDVGAMTGDAVSVVFDGCRWERGATLVLQGTENKNVKSLSITVRDNNFEDAVLSPVGSFPPKTKITISGNRFNVTRGIPVPGLVAHYASCVLTKKLTLSDYSSLVIMRNSFHTIGSGSVPISIGDGGMDVLSHSLFAITGNEFTMTDNGGVVFRVLSTNNGKALQVNKNSVAKVEGNTVSGVLATFVDIPVLEVKEKSSLVVKRNDGLVVTNVVKINDLMKLDDSWVLIHKNNAYDIASVVCYIGTANTSRKSRLVVSGNSVSPVTGEGIAYPVSFGARSSHKGDNTSELILSCNKPGDVGENIPESVSKGVFTVKNEGCDESCSSASLCFPGYTSTTSSTDCTCACVNGGHGDHCLPVEVPKDSDNLGVDDDPCVRDVNVTWGVFAGFGVPRVCYVGVTFSEDVVVDVSLMAGSVRSVTLTNCTMMNGASLYIVGWKSEPPSGKRVDVSISGLESRSGGGVLLANKYPSGSRITVVDSKLISETSVTYRNHHNTIINSNDLGTKPASIVLYNMNLKESVLTIARTQVVAVFDDAIGVLVTGGLEVSSGSALYMDRLSLQTSGGVCVAVNGDVTATGGSVLAFLDSDFLLCKHAVSVSGGVSVTGKSVVSFERCDFASTHDYAVAFESTVQLTGESMFMMKGNAHDHATKEMLYVKGAVTVTQSTLSFVRNHVGFTRMVAAQQLSNGDVAYLKVACNRVGGGALLSTVEQYAAAGFKGIKKISILGCDTCDKDTYCYAPGTVSASEKDGDCMCTCKENGGYGGKSCMPVKGANLKPAPRPIESIFEIENTVVRSRLVVPNGASEVALRHVVLDGVSLVIYVPWMSPENVRIEVQNVSFRNGAVLYVMGGTGSLRAGSLSETQQVEMSLCSVEAFNGVVVLTGKFPTNSVLTMTESLLITTEETPLVYLPGTKSTKYTPSLVLSGLQLRKSTLMIQRVAFLAVKMEGRTVVVEGTSLQLNGGGGAAVDKASFGGDYALYVGTSTVLSEGSVMRVSESEVYAGRGLMFGDGLTSSASAVVLTDNTGALSSEAFLAVNNAVSFVSGSWLTVRGNNFVGGQKLLSLPSDASKTEFSESTLTLYGNIVDRGSHVMNGTVTIPRDRGHFVVGCMKHNGQTLNERDYASVGITGHTSSLSCGQCDARANCFAAATESVSGSSCKCTCTESGFGRDCLPVRFLHVDACNRTVKCPALEVSTLSGHRLTINDIRAPGDSMKGLTVALPSPFRWARDTDLRLYSSFALASRVQPDGFSGQWGKMIRNSTWEHDASNSRGTLVLTLPSHDKYFIGLNEEIILEYSPRALHGGCIGTLQGTFTVEANTPAGLTHALLVLSNVGAGAAALVVTAGGAAALLLNAQVFGMFAMMTCAPAWERESFKALPYFLSVFTELGNLWMVVGNALIIIVFGCVHYAATVAYSRCRGVDSATDAWAAMRFPSLTYLVAYIMHSGICVGSVLLLVNPEAKVRDYVVGAFGAAYGVAFPAAVLYFIFRRSKAEFLEYTDFSKRSRLVRWMCPAGYWSSPKQNDMYGFVYMQVRGKHSYGGIFLLCMLCLVGVVAALPPLGGTCHVSYFTMAGILFIGGCVVLVTNMMRSVFMTVMSTASLLLLSALSYSNAGGYLGPSDGWVRAHAFILLLLLGVLFTIAVYIVVIWIMETYMWGPLRVQRKHSCEPACPDNAEKGKNVDPEPVSPVEPGI